MSAPLSFARHQVFASIVQQVTQFFALADAQLAASLAALEADAAQLTQDCLLPAVALVVEEQPQQVETDPAVVRCGCGQPAHYKGATPRPLVTQAGTLTFRRAYYYCKACQAGFYSLDAALGLGLGQFSEGVQAGVCRLGAELPFARAAATYTALTGVFISPREVACLTEARGAAWEEELAAERTALLQGNPLRAAAPRQADGGRGWWCFPQRVEILDWYHAVEHLWAAGNGLYGGGRRRPTPGWWPARKSYGTATLRQW